MGRAYSINGYLNATLRRTSKTLLVEGPSDKIALHRIAVERDHATAAGIAIDHAGMLDDVQLKGFGNRERVRHVQACADAMRPMVPKIEHVFATLTDREWDGIAFTNFVPANGWAPPVQEQNKFVTVGHSFENYHFDLDCIIEYLKHGFPEQVSAALTQLISERFSAVLVLATILSLKVRDDSCIGRCSKIMALSHLEYKNSRYYLAPSFGAACNQRGIPTFATIVAEVNAAVDAAWGALHLKQDVQWLPHGHIGSEVLWVGIGHVALEAKVSLEMANQIAHGFQAERARFQASWLSRANIQKRIPLDLSIDWFTK